MFNKINVSSSVSMTQADDGLNIKVWKTISEDLHNLTNDPHILVNTPLEHLKNYIKRSISSRL